MKYVVYDRINQELRVSWNAFAASNEAIQGLDWKVEKGDNIEPKDLLFQITWIDGQKKQVKAPAGCKGTVQARNKNYKIDRFPEPPSQWLLCIKSNE